MLTSIKVKQRDPREKMFPESRVNFGKMYTVEHNVKVYDFGDVRRGSLSTLEKQWKWVLSNNLRGDATNFEPIEEEEEEDEVNGGDDDEDNEAEPNDEIDEPEVALPANGTALWPWAANDHGQLAFQTGDTILITDWADENWGRGKNLRTGKRGVFARNYVSIEAAAT